jgi:hypothetical protein
LAAYLSKAKAGDLDVYQIARVAMCSLQFFNDSRGANEVSVSLEDIFGQARTMSPVRSELLLSLFQGKRHRSFLRLLHSLSGREGTLFLKEFGRFVVPPIQK